LYDFLAADCVGPSAASFRRGLTLLFNNLRGARQALLPHEQVAERLNRPASVSMADAAARRMSRVVCDTAVASVLPGRILAWVRAAPRRWDGRALLYSSSNDVEQTTQLYAI